MGEDMRITVAVAIVASLAVSACATVSRQTSFASDRGIGADAKFEDGGRSFAVWVHPKEDVVMFQRSTASAMGKGLARGLTYGLVEARDPYDMWKSASSRFIGAFGCSVTELRPQGEGDAYEASYACPAGTDLRAIVYANRESLRGGALPVATK